MRRRALKEDLRLKKIIKNIRLADWMLFLVLLVVSVAGIFITKEALPRGTDVTIEINGEPAYTFPLNVDRMIPVSSSYGETLVEIKEGRVRIREAHCPNRICVKQGWVSKGVIICLPNKILVIVGSGGGDKPGKDIDAVTG